MTDFRSNDKTNNPNRHHLTETAFNLSALCLREIINRAKRLFSSARVGGSASPAGSGAPIFKEGRTAPSSPHLCSVGRPWGAPLGRIRVLARKVTGTHHPHKPSPSAAPKVHFPRQPTATPWENRPKKHPQPRRGVPDRPHRAGSPKTTHPSPPNEKPDCSRDMSATPHRPAGVGAPG